MNVLNTWRENPFAVLGASPQDPHELLLELETEMALFGEAQAAEQAVSALLHPQSRLEAELGWFPQTSAGEIRELLACLEVLENQEEPMIRIPQLHTRSTLAAFNSCWILLHFFIPVQTEQYCAVVHSFVTAADALLAPQVMEELNADRKTAGFPLLQKEAELKKAIAGILERGAAWLADRLPPPLRRPEQLDQITAALEKEVRDRHSPFYGSYLQELTVQELKIPRR